MENERVKKPVYKKWWFWAIIGVVALAVIGTIAGTAGGGSDETKTPGGKTEQNHYIGDTAASGSVEFRVNNVTDTTMLGNEYLGASTENNFIVIELTVKNTGSSEVDLISSYFGLKKGDATYEVHSGSIYLENGFYVLQTIGAGIDKKIVVAFEVPSKSSEETYTLTVKGGSLSKEESIVLSRK